MTFSDFFDRLAELDWLAVIVGAALFVVIAFIWYGPVFAKPWGRLTGIAPGGPMGMRVAWTVVYSIVLSAALEYFLVGATFDDAGTRIQHALVTGILLGVLLVAAAMFQHVVWEGRPHTLWLIDAGYLFVSIAVVTYVQSVMG